MKPCRGFVLPAVLDPRSPSRRRLSGRVFPAYLPKTRCLSPRVAAVPIPPKKLKQGPRLVRIGRWGGWPRFSHSGRPNHDVLHACGQHAFAFLPPQLWMTDG